MLLIRAAAVSDVPLLLRLFRELAEYEREPDAVVITEEMLIKDGFGTRPKFRSLIAEWDGEATGYARRTLGFQTPADAQASVASTDLDHRITGHVVPVLT
jgi:hypothetical protein